MSSNWPHTSSPFGRRVGSAESVFPPDSESAEGMTFARVGDAFSHKRMIKSGTRRIIVDLRDVRWIQAERDYAVLHLGTERYVIRATMAALERSLASIGFCRIHRSTIVNIACVREIRHTPSGGTAVVMENGITLKSSRSYYRRLLCCLAGPRFTGTAEEPASTNRSTHLA